jgi:hypothetical protein
MYIFYRPGVSERGLLMVRLCLKWFLGIDKREGAWFYETRRGEALVMNKGTFRPMIFCAVVVCFDVALICDCL